MSIASNKHKILLVVSPYPNFLDFDVSRVRVHASRLAKSSLLSGMWNFYKHFLHNHMHTHAISCKNPSYDSSFQLLRRTHHFSLRWLNNKTNQTWPLGVHHCIIMWDSKVTRESPKDKFKYLHCFSHYNSQACWHPTYHKMVRSLQVWHK